MAKSENKTKVSNASVEAFLNKVESEQKRQDAFKLLEMMSDISGFEARMWGPSLIGFGQYHYVYESGREGDFFRVGFSPRKNALTVYIMPGFERFDKLMDQLGKFKTGKSCLYIKKLEDVDLNILKELIRQSLKYMKREYPD